ncbi:hypothetical protein [Sessilibacter corallicola]|uniref:hypothetical protein n=1 Tax=Sessilibacter corallicola TaxID=2904075 RepID=UPI003340D51B
MESLKKISKIIEESHALSKTTLFFMMSIGGIYLNGFLSEFNIPFPLEISVLPTILFLIGIISLIILIFLIIYTIIVGLINQHAVTPQIIGLILQNHKEGWQSNTLRNLITYSLYSYIIPLICLVVWIGFYQVKFSLLALTILFVAYLLWALIFGIVVTYTSGLPKKDRVKLTLSMTTQIFLIQLLSFLSFSILLLFINERAKNISEIEIILYVIFYSVINFICTYPISLKDKPNEFEDLDEKLTSNVVVQKSQQYPTFTVIFSLFAISLTPNVSPYVGELPLRLLNVGGGQEIAIISSRQECNTWPEIIIRNNDKNKETCITKTAKLLVQLGNRAYLIFNDEKIKGFVISLDIGKASIIKKIPQNSYYFNEELNSNQKNSSQESKVIDKGSNDEIFDDV